MSNYFNAEGDGVSPVVPESPKGVLRKDYVQESSDNLQSGFTETQRLAKEAGRQQRGEIESTSTETDPQENQGFFAGVGNFFRNLGKG